MAQDLGVTISGDRALELAFDEFPQRAHSRLLTDITTFTKRLEALVRSRAPVRTGKLQSQIVSRISDREEAITGQVTIAGASGSQDFAKAGAEEWGAHNARKPLRAHPMRLDHVFANRLNAPITVMVAAHSRTPNIAAQRFMRGSIEEMGPEILQGLREGVIETERAT